MFERNKKEAPVLGLLGSGGGLGYLTGGAIAAKTYVDDVFSTYVYTGTSSAGNAINNGIDLVGEGGIVWVKNRGATDHHLVTHQAGSFLTPSSSESEFTGNTGFISSFNSNGFTLGGGVRGSNNGDGQVSWTFRKAPGFFDVVTYTGNGVAGRTVSHALGSVPGMIVIKRSSASEDWIVGHRSIGLGTGRLMLNDNTGNSNGSATQYWNSTAATSSQFTVGSHVAVNGNGSTYVAYIFAHDDAQFGTDEDESIIKCGTYTGTGSSNNTITLGFEPQLLMIKNSSNSGDWMMLDNMRGVGTGSGVDDYRLWANKTDAESGYDNAVDFTSTGFKMMTGSVDNTSSNTYVYMAIRRPHKPPTAGTDVFAVDTRGSTGDGKEPTYRAPFPVDMQFNRNVNYAGGDTQISARLTQGRQMFTNLTNQESSNSAMMFDYMNGVQTDTGTGTDQYAWMFKRAPGFFDVVTYTGDGSSNRQISHNLDAVPELLIVKQRDASREWAVYSAGIGVGKFLKLRENVALTTQSGLFDTAPTSSIFTVETNTYVNISSGNYIAYLFATLPGISKVGSYSGSSSAVDVDCGFTNGARFVLIKRTDQSGNWFVFDTTRGIVSGNDPALWLNSTNAQITNTDYIDPLSSGFTVTTASGDINESGGTYIFLAIA